MHGQLIRIKKKDDENLCLSIKANEKTHSLIPCSDPDNYYNTLWYKDLINYINPLSGLCVYNEDNKIRIDACKENGGSFSTDDWIIEELEDQNKIYWNTDVLKDYLTTKKYLYDELTGAMTREKKATQVHILSEHFKLYYSPPIRFINPDIKKVVFVIGQTNRNIIPPIILKENLDYPIILNNDPMTEISVFKLYNDIATQINDNYKNFSINAYQQLFSIVNSVLTNLQFFAIDNNISVIERVYKSSQLFNPSEFSIFKTHNYKIIIAVVYDTTYLSKDFKQHEFAGDEKIKPNDIINFLQQNKSDIDHTLYQGDQMFDPEEKSAAEVITILESKILSEKIIDDIMMDKDITLSKVDINQTALLAGVQGKLKVIKRLYNDISDSTLQYIGSFASERGYTDIVKFLIDNNKSVTKLMTSAISNGHTKIVELLLADPRVDPSIYNNLAIRLASYNGYSKIVELLLADPRVDPSARDNEAIRFASKYGYSKVVKLLLADPRVDPSARDNEAFIQAVNYINNINNNVYNKTVILLLNYRNPKYPNREVNPSARDNYVMKNMKPWPTRVLMKLLIEHTQVITFSIEALTWAVKEGTIEHVKKILLDHSLDPNGNQDFPPIYYAFIHNKFDIVKILLDDARVDPTIKDNFLIKTASEYGYTDLVEQLLADPRVNPAVDNYFAIRMAAKNGHKEIVKLLIQYKNEKNPEREITTEIKKEIFNIAIKNEWKDIIKTLEYKSL